VAGADDLLGRGTLDQYGHIVLFATGDIHTQARTPDGIWEELRGQVSVRQPVSEPSTGIQFPAETIAKRAGSPRDIALLVASAYDTAGLRPSLVHGYAGPVPNADAIYVRVKWREGYVMLDPASFNQTFENAITAMPGAVFYDLQTTRLDLNLTVISLDKDLITPRPLS